ncbi:MAG: VTT domain-containing protein [Chloroflexi bacterium]|nr:VTT domain-containing protein [Chloroflexota bacterium]
MSTYPSRMAEVRHPTDDKRSTLKLGKAIYAAGVVGLFALAFLALLRFQEALSSMGNWGYPIAFLVELVNSASLFIPSPGRVYTLSVSLTLDPFFLGLLAGIGAALGELTGYYAGARGRGFIEGKRPRWLRRLHALRERRIGAVLFAMAFLPVPFDIAGLWAGAIRYPIARFLLYTTPGKVLKMTAIALAGHYGLTRLLSWVA